MTFSTLGESNVKNPFNRLKEKNLRIISTDIAKVFDKSAPILDKENKETKK